MVYIKAILAIVLGLLFTAVLVFLGALIYILIKVSIILFIVGVVSWGIYALIRGSKDNET